MSKTTVLSSLSKEAYLLGVLNDCSVLLLNAYKKNGEAIYNQTAAQAQLAQALLEKDLQQLAALTLQHK